MAFNCMEGEIKPTVFLMQQSAQKQPSKISSESYLPCFVKNHFLSYPGSNFHKTAALISSVSLTRLPLQILEEKIVKQQSKNRIVWQNTNFDRFLICKLWV